MDYRTEKDSMGPVQVPNDRYYGSQTQRSLNEPAPIHKTLGHHTRPINPNCWIIDPPLFLDPPKQGVNNPMRGH